MFITERSRDIQNARRKDLEEERRRTDRAIDNLTFWPPHLTDVPQTNVRSFHRMFRSKHLFSAVLNNHRFSPVDDDTGAIYFRDEMEFYGDVMSTMIGWLNREDVCRDCGDDGGIGGTGGGRRYRWVHSYGYLVAAIGHLGAERALCRVFESVVCLSHRETFYYVNFSYGAEALFRLYRQSYPVDREGSGSGRRRSDDWRTRSHVLLFPELASCRREILATMASSSPAGPVASSLDPSACGASVRSGSDDETQTDDETLMLRKEETEIRERLRSVTDDDCRAARRRVRLGVFLLGGCLAYVLAALGTGVVLRRRLRSRLVPMCGGRVTWKTKQRMVRQREEDLREREAKDRDVTNHVTRLTDNEEEEEEVG